MSERELKFERKLAMHTAPTLLGIKCAGLLSLSMDEFDVEAHLEFFNRRAVSRGLKIKQLCCCKNRALILLYSEKLMEKRLSDCTAKQLLAGYGYGENLSFDECLDRLSERICEHGDFPHEIGVFSDIPLKMSKALSRTTAETSSFVAAGRFTATWKRRSVRLQITEGAENFCAIN